MCLFQPETVLAGIFSIPNASRLFVLFSGGAELQQVSALTTAQCELNAAHQTNIFLLCWKKGLVKLY